MLTEGQISGHWTTGDLARTILAALEEAGVDTENLTAAESFIRDTNIAAETSIFTRNQIMVQASTAMLAQANVIAQNVLQLLG